MQFRTNIEALIASTSIQEEEEALGSLLRTARQTNVNYGYRVHSKTTGRDVPHTEVYEHLNEDLMVIILVGEKEPYEEFVWQPHSNELITRLIVP